MLPPGRAAVPAYERVGGSVQRPDVAARTFQEYSHDYLMTLGCSTFPQCGEWKTIEKVPLLNLSQRYERTASRAACRSRTNLAPTQLRQIINQLGCKLLMYAELPITN